MNLEQYVKSKKIEERAVDAAKRAVDEVMRGENQLYQIRIADPIRSEFEYWFDQYENNIEYAAKQIAKDAYELGLQHRQTEVDELQKKLHLCQIEIGSLVSRTGIDHKQIESLRNSTNELQKRLDAAIEAINEHYESDGMSGLMFMDLREILMGEQTLKGDSTINSTMGESGECLHFSTTLFNDGKAECFHCDAVVNEEREVIGKQSKGLHPFFKKELP